MTALAQTAIEQVLGVETSLTVYRKHLYELRGFKEILGPDTVDLLTKGEEITDGRPLEIPMVTVALRGRGPYAPLCNLKSKEIGQTGKGLFVIFDGEDGSVRIRFTFDFAEERLVFDIFKDLAVRDNGTPDDAERVAEVQRFKKDYLGNGQLHVRDAETEELIARKDAFIPVNMWLDVQAADAEIARWKNLAEERRQRNRLYRDEMIRLSKPYIVYLSVGSGEMQSL
jgi:hypothetical protein